MASAWLRKAAYALADGVFAPCGVKIDAGRFDPAFGYPAGMQKHSKHGYIGGIALGTSAIIITPRREPIRVLDVITHEMVHMAAPGDNHGALFARFASAVGLLPPWPATSAGPELVAKLQAIVNRIGPMPTPSVAPEPPKRAYIEDKEGNFQLVPSPWLPPRHKRDLPSR